LAEAPDRPLQLPLLPGVFVTCLRPYYRRSQKRDPFSEIIRLHKKQPIGQTLGFLLAEHLRQNTNVPEQIDVLVPVPPDPDRFVIRRFDPVGELATWASRFLAVPIREVLRKTAGTSRSYQTTLEELRSAFGLWDPQKAKRLLTERSVLLIDDVIRMGQTARICIDLLSSAGAATVLVAALAYVPGYRGPSIWDDLEAARRAG
jgi:predicted amidophosphoribosyltransferase